MKHTILFLTVSYFVVLACKGEDFTITNMKEEISLLKSLLMDVNTRLQNVEDKNQVLEKENFDVSSQLHDIQDENSELRSKLDDINAEVEHLNELSKLLSVRTCNEMKKFGVNKSDYYIIDPDGPLNGKEPIRVYCDFTEDFGFTQISHNSEEKIEVTHCDDPGCYSRPIIYDSPTEQIKALIELSESCSQQIAYDCFLSPLQDEGIDYAYWVDINGENQIYWTGEHFGEHVCSCHYSEEGCEDSLHNTCNCDSNAPKELSDVGTITNITALPINELRFGGLLYDAQSGFHTLGKLICSGEKTEERKATSCSALKRDGFFRNGYYNVKEPEQYSKLVYCDMTSPGYDDVTEEFIESSATHFIEIEKSISDIKVDVLTYLHSTLILYLIMV